MLNTENLQNLFEDQDYESIFNQLGYESYELDDEDRVRELVEDLRTIQDHGVTCGVHGFIYVSEIESFYEKNEFKVNSFINNYGDENWFEINELSDLLDTKKYTNNIETAVNAYVEHLINLIDLDELIKEIDEDEE